MSYTKGGLRRLVGIGLNRGVQPWESQVPQSLGVSYGGGRLGFVIGRNSGGAAAEWSLKTSRLGLSTLANPNSKSMSTSSNPNDVERKGDYKTPKTSFLTMLDRLSDVFFLTEIFRGLALTVETFVKPTVRRRKFGWVDGGGGNAYVAMVGRISIRERRRSAFGDEFG